MVCFICGEWWHSGVFNSGKYANNWHPTHFLTYFSLNSGEIGLKPPFNSGEICQFMSIIVMWK